ncbi:MAG: hypothetical protein H6Q64_1892, partial [Firmicutes bacterium]|nr:hypothetical protein [Bacillota bacterium]
MKGNEKLSEIFNQNPYMAVIMVDKDGKVTFINETYAKVLRLPPQKVLGRSITAITPTTQTTKVLRTGKAVTAYNWNINGHQMIGCALPMFDGDELVGCFAYSISLNIWDSKTLLERLIAENNMLKEVAHKYHTAKYEFDDLVGIDISFLNAKSLAQQVAYQPQTRVLITGETGTGKELFAQAIHNASPRANCPFVRVNCAAIPENLLEAELFGYETGAYTGAKKGGRMGKFELANNGTIFLDEIGELPLAMQSKLLVVLQEKELERIGGDRPIKLDVRVISATNRNLPKMVENGLFRQDLYYRLNVVQVEIPPLRERQADISLLIDYILEKLNQRLGTEIQRMSREVSEILQKYHWPGNVRELENVMERAVSLAFMEKTQILDKRHFEFLRRKSTAHYPTGKKSLKMMIQESEEKIISRMLEENGFDKVLTAEALDIDL